MTNSPSNARFSWQKSLNWVSFNFWRNACYKLTCYKLTSSDFTNNSKQTYLTAPFTSGDFAREISSYNKGEQLNIKRQDILFVVMHNKKKCNHIK